MKQEPEAERVESKDPKQAALLSEWEMMRLTPSPKQPDQLTLLPKEESK